MVRPVLLAFVSVVSVTVLLLNFQGHQVGDIHLGFAVVLHDNVSTTNTGDSAATLCDRNHTLLSVETPQTPSTQSTDTAAVSVSEVSPVYLRGSAKHIAQLSDIYFKQGLSNVSDFHVMETSVQPQANCACVKVSLTLWSRTGRPNDFARINLIRSDLLVNVSMKVDASEFPVITAVATVTEKGTYTINMTVFWVNWPDLKGCVETTYPLEEVVVVKKIPSEQREECSSIEQLFDGSFVRQNLNSRFFWKPATCNMDYWKPGSVEASNAFRNKWIVGVGDSTVEELFGNMVELSGAKWNFHHNALDPMISACVHRLRVYDTNDTLPDSRFSFLWAGHHIMCANYLGLSVFDQSRFTQRLQMVTTPSSADSPLQRPSLIIFNSGLHDAANPTFSFAKYETQLRQAIEMLLTRSDKVWLKATVHKGARMKCFDHGQIIGTPTSILLNQIMQSVASEFDPSRVRYFDVWKLRAFLLDEMDGHHCSSWNLNGFSRKNEACFAMQQIFGHAIDML